jgi:hypothetical protein
LVGTCAVGMKECGWNALAERDVQLAVGELPAEAFEHSTRKRGVRSYVPCELKEGHHPLGGDVVVAVDLNDEGGRRIAAIETANDRVVAQAREHGVHGKAWGARLPPEPRVNVARGTPAATLRSRARDFALAGPVGPEIAPCGDDGFHLEAGFQFLYGKKVCIFHDILQTVA